MRWWWCCPLELSSPPGAACPSASPRMRSSGCACPVSEMDRTCSTAAYRRAQRWVLPLPLLPCLHITAASAAAAQRHRGRHTALTSSTTPIRAFRLDKSRAVKPSRVWGSTPLVLCAPDPARAAAAATASARSGGGAAPRRLPRPRPGPGTGRVAIAAASLSGPAAPEARQRRCCSVAAGSTTCKWGAERSIVDAQCRKRGEER
jgi:hypothetical protein